ncbi:hypothetical protein EJ08DRAFT_25535 [Tothia fuscella]|uniref:Uncharacterized protein n=1 Tax=Tothia fuscella TaxID=1048955 RepID=A0A9P4TT75_9PEZI|nr:hypothetical protein EJ08DRAFT_25535 [Tothia fuscella]
MKSAIFAIALLASSVTAHDFKRSGRLNRRNALAARDYPSFDSYSKPTPSVNNEISSVQAAAEATSASNSSSSATLVSPVGTGNLGNGNVGNNTSSATTPSLPLGTGNIGNGNSGAINASDFNISTTNVATISSLSTATSTQTVLSTLLLVNGTSTKVIPTTMVVTATRTVLVYFTGGSDGMLPVSTSSAASTEVDAQTVQLSVTESVATETLTYKLGAGESTSVVTATVLVTNTKTLTQTKYATSSASSNDVKPAFTGGSSMEAINESSTPAGPTVAAESSTSEETVTLRSTRTNTVFAGASSISSSVVAAAGTDGGNQGNAASPTTACAVAATVTATKTEKSTVTVVSAPNHSYSCLMLIPSRLPMLHQAPVLLRIQRSQRRDKRARMTEKVATTTAMRRAVASIVPHQLYLPLQAMELSQMPPLTR